MENTTLQEMRTRNILRLTPAKFVWGYLTSPRVSCYLYQQEVGGTTANGL
jgi:hypothetical protein